MEQRLGVDAGEGLAYKPDMLHTIGFRGQDLMLLPIWDFQDPHTRRTGIILSQASTKNYQNPDDFIHSMESGLIRERTISKSHRILIAKNYH
jgi:hypothetical protein